MAHAGSTIIPRALRHPFLHILWTIAIAIWLTPAWGETDLEAGERLYMEAKNAEERLDFRAALTNYEASITRAPSGRWALASRARADDLKAHSEGDFTPLADLERVRRAPQTIESIDDLERRADGFPPGRVRAEARMLGAEAYLDRLGRPKDGERMLELVVADDSADVTIRQFAARRLADLAMARGQTDRALEVARQTEDPSLANRLVRVARRNVLRRMSLGILAIVVVLAAIGLRKKEARTRARSAMRESARPIVLFSIVLAMGGILAASYEHGTATPFVALALAIAIIAFLARAWSAIGSPRVHARALRSTACALAVVAAGFLVLDRMGAMFLEGFGL